MNLSITAIARSSGVEYFPSFIEIFVTIFVVSIGFAAFALAVKYLPIFPKTGEHTVSEHIDYETLVSQKV
jgi:Ni/Fe-hydrogenase subunit HybB-like protein